MQEHKPLYLYSREEALRHGERDQWRDSYRENCDCDCARAIERAIAENYHDNGLEDCAGSILDRYGFTRVNWVLANTMQQKSYDGRFSEDNKRWARQFYILRNKSATSRICNDKLKANWDCIEVSRKQVGNRFSLWLEA